MVISRWAHTAVYIQVMNLTVMLGLRLGFWFGPWPLVHGVARLAIIVHIDIGAAGAAGGRWGCDGDPMRLSAVAGGASFLMATVARFYSFIRLPL